MALAAYGFSQETSKERFATGFAEKFRKITTKGIMAPVHEIEARGDALFCVRMCIRPIFKVGCLSGGTSGRRKILASENDLSENEALLPQ